MDATQTETTPSNGAPAPAAPAARSAAIRAETDRLMREMATAGAEDKPAEEAPSETPAPAEEPPTPQAEPPKPAEDADDDEDGDEAETKPGKDEPADPELAKRLEAAQKQRQRDRAEIDRARDEAVREVETKRKELEREWAPKLEAAQRFETLSKRARYDAAGVLEALGVPLDDFEHVARAIFARSPKGSADPRYRDQAERSAREREYGDRLAALEAQNNKLTETLTRREQEAADNKAAVEYLDRTSKAVGEDMPLVKAMLGKSPDKARQRLAQVAFDLYQSTGEEPDPADVVRALETARRAELEEMGVDLDAVIKRPAAAPATKPPSKTLSSDMGSPTKAPSKPKSREELQAETDRNIRSGKLE